MEKDTFNFFIEFVLLDEVKIFIMEIFILFNEIGFVKKLDVFFFISCFNVERNSIVNG